MKEKGECVLASFALTNTLCISVEESQVRTSLFVVKFSSPQHLPASQGGLTEGRQHGTHQCGFVSLPSKAATGEKRLFSSLTGFFPAADGN